MHSTWLAAEIASTDPALQYARRVADGALLICEAPYADWIGTAPADGEAFGERVHAADRAAVAAAHLAAQEVAETSPTDGQPESVRYRWRGAGDACVPVMETFRCVRSPEGDLIRVGTLHNVSALAATEHELAAERDRIELVLDGTRLGLWDWNMQTGATVFNERWAEIIGYRLAELGTTTIQTWTDFANPEDLEKSNDLIERHAAGELPYYDIECRMRHRNGHWVWVRDRGRIVEWTDDGQPLRMTGTHEDITDRKHSEVRLLAEALTDELTGLANRRRLQRELDALVDEPHALVMLDLDGFKRINDELGHARGDDVLIAVAACVAAAVRPDDVPVRLAGDEFVVLVRTDDPRTVRAIADRIADTVSRIPSGLPDSPLVGASIGVARSGERGGPQDLLRVVDRSLYDAKREGGRRIRGV